MTTAELCAAIDADTTRLVASIETRISRLDACLAASAQLVEMARVERDRIVARFTERAA